MGSPICDLMSGGYINIIMMYSCKGMQNIIVFLSISHSIDFMK